MMPSAESSGGAVRRDRPAGAELARVHDEFFAARHSEDDVEWADRVFVHMGFADVRLDQAELLLHEAAATVMEAREDAHELFGAPTEWADERIRELRESGLDVFEDPLLMGPRETVITAVGLASGLSALLVLVQLLNRVFGDHDSPDDLTPGFALVPLLLAGAITALITVFKRATPRFRFPVVIGLCAVTLALSAAGIASIIVPLGQSDLRAAWGWAFLLVPLYAVLAWVIAKLWPKSTPSSAPPLTTQQILDSADLDDDTWLQRARAALRHREDLADARIDAVLEEARGHAADSGSTLLAEFGSPEGYAQKIPRDRTTKPRRMALLYAVLAVLWLALGLVNASDAHWSMSWSLLAPAALTVLCALSAIGAAREWRRAVRMADDASG